MALLVLDPEVQKQMIARRRRLGIDRHDEVWDGVYVMSPLADDSHQDIATGIAAVLRLMRGMPEGTKVRAGMNISDRVEGWKQNYRCPDVVVFLPGTKAVCHEQFWHGGPDFAVEIRSRGDRTRKKLPFYALVGTRELLVVDRRPRRLELYRLTDDRRMASTGIATVENQVELASEVLPLSFRLSAGDERPAVVLCHHDGREWSI